MPPLARSRDSASLVLPARTATVIADCDVLVVGGGPAGLGAALGAADAGAEVILCLPPGEAYHIPLRCLLPQRVDRVLVAGRCISGTHEAHSSYRVMPIAMATGQAAGVCAALAARVGKAPRDVPAADVQTELARQGAVLAIPGS